MRTTRTQTFRGSFVILVLVFSAVFLTLISALSGYIFTQKRAQLAKENLEKAFHIAEAGLEYYRWFLAHHPGDFTAGTGNPGPHQFALPDPEGGTIGTFSISVEGDVYCGVENSVRIRSTGWTAADGALRRAVEATYARPTVAGFSHIVDAHVWAGPDRVISGPYHSNGGVRMDATHNSTVSSGLSSWLCTASFGCAPDAMRDGVFGAGSNPELWSFPTTPVDFEGISVNLSTLRQFALSNGRHIPHSGSRGWRITFHPNGTFDARRVTAATQVWGYSIEEGWQQERRVVGNQQNATTHTIPADCPVVFVEDEVWIEGTVSGKVIFVAANTTDPGISHSVVLNGNLVPANPETDGITVIGQENILIGINVPDVMTIHGIFIAQNGRFGRNHYCDYDCAPQSGNQSLPGSLTQYVTRNTLNTIGTVVSKNRVGTKWTAGGAFLSGFNQRFDTYDRRLADAPPPFTPHVSEDFLLRGFREVNPSQ